MLDTKTRNTITAIVASLSFAGMATAPAISQAEPNGELTPQQRCAAMQEDFQHAMQAGEYMLAHLLEEKAGQFGCKWAGGNKYREAVPTSGPKLLNAVGEEAPSPATPRNSVRPGGSSLAER